MNACCPQKECKAEMLPALTIIILFFLTTGCAITEDYKRPVIESPPAWRVKLEDAKGLADTDWWHEFQDPALNELIQIALIENRDLLIATARIEAAQARLMGDKANYYPQITYGASATRRKESENRTYAFGEVIDSTHTIYKGYLGASWELDIWGRVKRSTEAARAELLSEKDGRQAVILMLVSSIAKSYINLLSVDQKLKNVQDTIASRKKWLQLFEDKKAGGQISELELSQVRTSYQEALTMVAELELQIAIQENAISILLGKNPGTIKRGGTLDTLAVPAVPQVIPSDLLIRRPDIRQSEQKLIAANARIGVARTLYFPSISLSGIFGYASSETDNLFTSPSSIWEATGGLLGSIFSGGSIKSKILEKEAIYKQLLFTYLRTIQNAFREVNDSLVSIQKLRKMKQTKQQLVHTLENYYRHSRESYDAGFANYLTVMSAEEKLFQEQMQYIETQSDLFSATVNAYMTMGGGLIQKAADMLDTSIQEQETEKGALK